MITRVLVLNGPNPGRLGSREPEVHGDDEREMISWVHEAADARLPVVLNPAAREEFRHTPGLPGPVDPGRPAAP